MTTMSRTAWGLDSGQDQVWRQRAACSPAVAEWFWPAGQTGRGGGVKLTVENRMALVLCRQCPVQPECHAYELAHPNEQRYLAANRLWPGGQLLTADLAFGVEGGNQ